MRRTIRTSITLNVTLFILLLLVSPGLIHGQSALNFPRYFSTADLGSVGFAVVNPSVTAATATFTLYGSAGGAVATATQTIPAAGQLAKLGSPTI